MQKVIKSKTEKYLIKKNDNGFFCEVRPRNIFRYWKELFTDFIGDTYIHPVLLTNMYFKSIESMEKHIHISIELDEKNSHI